MKKLVAGLALAIFSLMAQAQSLVVNGNFENGLTGWNEVVVPGTTSQHGVINFGPSLPDNFYSTGFSDPTTLSQLIDTVVGTRYDLSFDLRGLKSVELPKNYSQVTFGTYSYEPLGFDNGSFTTFTYKGLLADAATTALSFRASSDKSFVHLDNVSLQVSAVPEPETYAMMLLGLGLIGYTMRRRHKG
ncbi:MAG: hypothetical protein ACI9ZF_003624 [Bradyrhizobium sp.]|jgi:hypothetical protein